MSDIAVANALGACLARLGQPARAIDVLQAAIKLRPDLAEIYVNLGTVQMASGDLIGARDSFERALGLHPDHPEALGRLAVLASHRGDRIAMRDLAERTLAINKTSAHALRTLLDLDLDDGRFGEAEARARAWIADPAMAPGAAEHAFGLWGDALDGLGAHAQAYQAYAQSKAVFVQTNAKLFQPLASRPVSAILAALEGDFARTSSADWRLDPTPGGDPGEQGAARRHVFLMGFMRSGTTLLEQALSRHPDVVVLEETGAFAEAGADLLQQPGGAGRLAKLGAGEADRYRQAYWAAVRQAGIDPVGKVLIDKLPFNGIKLPLIAKLFPNAKIIFALRDPRDVVLSCFRRRLRANAFSYELASLAGGAKLYDRYMHLVEGYRGKLPLDILDHRHEALVTDFEATVRAACRHIDLDWRSDLADFAAGARRGAVVSQSSRQLAAGLNADGLDRWRDYRGDMASVLPILTPWAGRFGYALD